MFLEYVRMALETLRTNKLRSILTLLGMVIGVFSVIASVTAVQVIDQYFNDSFQFLGSTTFTVQRTPAISFSQPDDAIRNRPAITYAQFEELQRRASLPVGMGVDEWFSSTRITSNTEETTPNITVRGVDEEFLANNGYELDRGRFISDDEVRYARPVTVLTEPVAETLFPNEEAIGKSVMADGNRYTVIGILKEKGSVLGESQDNFIFCPITRMFTVYGGINDRNIGIDVRAASVDLLGPTMDEATGIMRAIRRDGPFEENSFELVTNDALQGPFQTFTSFLTLGGAIIGLIALLAAGIGIMNIMLVSVTERTREIGIRKSLGARKSAILTQFLIEALVLCQIGGLVGILLGVGIGNLITQLSTSLRPTLPWDWAMYAVLGVTVIALVFGIYPAYRAARLNPIEALRYE